MAYLGLALFAEGPSDRDFLSPLLRRLCEDVCCRFAKRPVDVGDMTPLTTLRRGERAARAERIAEAAIEALGAWHLLFVHTDGGAEPQRAAIERVRPAFERLSERLDPERAAGVAVVPVRETEAWVLADGDALRAALGTALSDRALGVPERPADVERIGDPKRAVDEAMAVVRRRRARRRGPDAPVFFGAIGEVTSLARLEEVPAFARLKNETVAALRSFHLLDA